MSKSGVHTGGLSKVSTQAMWSGSPHPPLSTRHSSSMVQKRLSAQLASAQRRPRRRCRCHLRRSRRRLGCRSDRRRRLHRVHRGFPGRRPRSGCRRRGHSTASSSRCALWTRRARRGPRRCGHRRCRPRRYGARDRDKDGAAESELARRILENPRRAARSSRLEASKLKDAQRFPGGIARTVYEQSRVHRVSCRRRVGIVTRDRRHLLNRREDILETAVKIRFDCDGRAERPERVVGDRVWDAAVGRGEADGAGHVAELERAYGAIGDSLKAVKRLQSRPEFFVGLANVHLEQLRRRVVGGVEPRNFNHRSGERAETTASPSDASSSEVRSAHETTRRHEPRATIRRYTGSPRYGIETAQSGGEPVRMCGEHTTQAQFLKT